jgi:hypothetical protein
MHADAKLAAAQAARRITWFMPLPHFFAGIPVFATARLFAFIAITIGELCMSCQDRGPDLFGRYSQV